MLGNEPIELPASLTSDGAQLLQDGITVFHAALSDDIGINASAQDVHELCFLAYADLCRALIDDCGCNSDTASKAARWTVANGMGMDARTPPYFRLGTLQ